MKKILLITLFFGSTNLFAQQQQDSTLHNTVKNLQSQVNQQQTDIQKIYSELNKEYRTYRIVKKDLNQTIINNQEEVIDSLNTLIAKSNERLSSINKELDTKIQETGQKADSQIAQLDSNVEKNQLYWIIATLATLLLGGLIYWLLGKRIKSSKTDVETQIRNTRASLEEESVKLDNKLVEVLETQLKLKQEETKAQPTPSNEKEDHSLALKVADEIIRIQKNLSRMDESTKGLKQLNSSVKRIQANFAANGYEIVEMLGMDYNDGMKVSANFIPSEDLESGKQIITRIIKPQVNFKGEMIQSAQIEVSIAE
jgi:predicted RNase H-like nuclease (RuvC/YqgF family)